MSLIPWWARALILAALVAAVGFAIHHLAASRQQIGYDRAQAEYTAAALVADQAARAKEHQLQATVATLGQQHEKTKQRAAVAAAAAGAELDGLRSDLAARDGAAGANPAATCGTDAARAGRIERELLQQCAAALQTVAAEADRIAGRLSGLQDYVRAVVPAAGAP